MLTITKLVPIHNQEAYGRALFSNRNVHGNLVDKGNFRENLTCFLSGTTMKEILLGNKSEEPHD
jgi:hypothetical protein